MRLDEKLPKGHQCPEAPRRMLGIQAIQDQRPSPVHHCGLNHFIIGDTSVRFQDECQGEHRRGRLSAAPALAFDTDLPALPGMAHQTRYAGVDAGTQTIWPSVSVAQFVPPGSKTLQAVANTMAASVLPLLLGFSRRTAVRAKGRSGSTSPIRRPLFWFNLPLTPFLSQCPDTLVPINVDHPGGQS